MAENSVGRAEASGSLIVHGEGPPGLALAGMGRGQIEDGWRWRRRRKDRAGDMSGSPETPVFLPGESPWPEEPGSLQSMGSQRFGHD